MKKILFICLFGRDRSARAVEIIKEEFSNDEFEAKCAGVSEIADTPLTEQAIEWTEKIVCMEREHRDALFQRFPEARSKEVVVWNIPNYFSFGNEGLGEELRGKIKIIKK